MVAFNKWGQWCQRRLRDVRALSVLDTELAGSPGIAIAMLLAMGCIVLAATDRVKDPDYLAQIQILGLAIVLVTLWAWDLLKQHGLVSRWVLILELLLLVVCGDVWLGIPGVLTFIFLPGVVATMLISLPAGWTASFLGLGLAWLVEERVPGSMTRPGIEPIVAATVICQSILFAFYHHLRQVSIWVDEQYREGYAMRERARVQKVELGQALEDLGEANGQLQQLNQVAQNLRVTAEEALAAKGRFVANVSHELRTPLNMITGFVEMITQVPETYGEVPPALLADLAVVQRNSEHLASLIDDVLDLSQIEQDEMALSKERVRFEEILDAAAIAVRPLFRARGLYLKKQIAEDLPAVFCDRTRMREVVLNLLSNAGRFTEKGGVTVSLRLRDGALECGIRDTGPGISPEHLERIFEPFHQADGTIRRRYGGSGLGLAISKRFIELHDGEIRIDSQEGQGTTFTFTLPVAQTAAPGTANWWRWATPQWEYLQRTRPSAAPSVRPRPRYVVAEKGGSLARLLSRYSQDIRIVSYSETAAALDNVAQSPTEALLINSPSVSDTLKDLSHSDLPSSVPVLICSVPGAHETANSLGVEDYLVKPIGRDVLLAALDALNLQGNTVLIVDDQPEAVRLFRRMLTSSGRDYRVLRANDGVEGLAMLRAQRPDVLLVDLSMPRMDGFHLLEERSHNPELAAIPTLVISARDPMGQPIVSGSLAITRGGGLSSHHLLAAIETMTRLLTQGQHNDDQALPAVSSD